MSDEIGRAYLYSAPHANLHGARRFGVVHTDFGAWLPDWWRNRQKLDIRITPLSEDDLKLPLIDIVKAHIHELDDTPADQHELRQPEQEGEETDGI